MFCTKCGCQIPPEASRCPDCGADLPVMEYCGGFWSELNQNTQAGRKADQTPDVEAQDPWSVPAGTAMDALRTDPEEPPVFEKSGESAPPEKEGRKPAGKSAGRAGKRSVLRFVPGVCAVVLLLLLAVSRFHYSGLKQRLEDTEERLLTQQEENEAIREDYRQLVAEYAPLYIQDTASRAAAKIWDASVTQAAKGMEEMFRDNEEETSDTDQEDQKDEAGQDAEQADQKDGTGQDAEQADQKNEAGQDAEKETENSVQKKKAKQGASGTVDP